MSIHIWKNVFDKISDERKDIFYDQRFAKVYQESLYKEHKILAAVCKFDNNNIIYPFVKRNLATNKKLSIGTVSDLTGMWGHNYYISENNSKGI